jgi:hypothetical protein
LLSLDNELCCILHDCSVEPKFSRNMLNGPSQPTIQIGTGQPRAFEAVVWSLVLDRIIEHDLHILSKAQPTKTKRDQREQQVVPRKHVHLLGYFRAKLVSSTGSTGAHGS